MTCREVSEHLDRGARESREALSAEVRKHIDQCSACGALWEFLFESEGPDADAVPQPEVEQLLLTNLQAVRPIPSKTTRAMGFLAVFGLVSAVFVGVMGVQGAAGMAGLQLAGVLAAAVLSAAMVSISLSAGVTPGESRLFPCIKVVLTGLAGLIALTAALFPWETGQDFLTHGLGCFVTGFAYSLPALGITLVLVRRGAPLQLETVGMGAGMLAGLVGLVILHLGCTMHTAPHVMLGHLTLPLLGAAMGYGLGRALPLITDRRAEDTTI